MNIKNFKGIEHIGIPSSNLDATIKFYQKLGFKLIYKNLNPNNNTYAAFLQLGNLIVESYESDNVKKSNGAVDHFAISVTDVETLYQEAIAEGYTITSDGLESLPFMKNGVKFFKISGPDKEEIEFLEQL